MVDFVETDRRFPTLTGSVKTFFNAEEKNQPKTFTDMVHWIWQRDFLWNLGLPYTSQTKPTLPRPRVSVYPDRRIYAYKLAIACNLMQEDYIDRLSIVGNQARLICERFIRIFAPDNNEFPTGVLNDQILFFVTSIPGIATSEVVQHLHILRNIGNKANHEDT